MKRISILLLILGLVLPLAAQRPGEQPRTAPDNDIIVDVDLVDLLVSVADRKGKFITNLKKEDFRVYEDDRLQTITNFSTETDLPLTIALLVDTSGSIRDKLKFEQEAAIEFFYSTLRRQKDKALVISFDSGVDLLQDFTDDPEILADAVRKIRAGGGTSLYDAIYLASTEKLATEQGRKVMIVISDGDDNSSRTSIDDALQVAQKHNVAIYGISTKSSAYFGSNEQERGDRTLRRFSEDTGGKPFFPLKIQELAVSFQDIGQELRSQYRIAYRTANAKADGSYRKVRVEVNNRNYRAKTRAGYYAARAAAASQKQD
jgi:Ca-activated chloride channel family protein